MSYGLIYTIPFAGAVTVGTSLLVALTLTVSVMSS